MSMDMPFQSTSVHGLFATQGFLAQNSLASEHAFLQAEAQRALRLLFPQRRGAEGRSRVETTWVWQAGLPLTAPENRGTSLLRRYIAEEPWHSYGILLEKERPLCREPLFDISFG